MSPPKFNPIEPPWYVTRMPGGVGGAAPRGVPLSRSTVFPDLFGLSFSVHVCIAVLEVMLKAMPDSKPLSSLAIG